MQQLEEQTAYRNQQQESMDQYRKDTLAQKAAELAATKENREDLERNRVRDDVRTNWLETGATDQVTADEYAKAIANGVSRGLFTPNQIPTLDAPGATEAAAPQTFKYTGGQKWQERERDRDLREVLFKAGQAGQNNRLQISLDQGAALAGAGPGGEGGRLVKKTYIDPESGQTVEAYVPITQAGVYQKPAPASMTGEASGLIPVAGMIDELDKMSQGINVDNGPNQMVRGWERVGKSKINKDDDVKQYMDNTEAFLALFARVAGEKGVLTEGDTGRARGMLPMPWHSKALRDKKIIQLRQFMERKFGALPAPFRQLPGGGPGAAAPGAGAGAGVSSRDDILAKYAGESPQ